MTTGERIRYYRKKKGLTQKELGTLANINEVQLRRYELDKANPKFETLNKIACALDVSIIQLKDEFKDAREIVDLIKDSVYQNVSELDMFIVILEQILGKMEQYENSADFPFGENYYYVVKNNNTSYILTDKHIEAIYNCIKSIIPSIVDIFKQIEF